MIKLSDITRHLGKTLNSKTSLKVFTEDINKITRPCLFIKNIGNSRVFLGQSIERLSASFDIYYFPSEANTSCNVEIQDALEAINEAFNKDAYKVLRVYDRTVVLNNISSNTVDNVGHYMFDINLHVEYGERDKYDLMRNLELDTNIEN